MIKHHVLVTPPLSNLTSLIQHVLFDPVQFAPVGRVLLFEAYPQLLVLSDVLVLLECQLVGQVLVEARN